MCVIMYAARREHMPRAHLELGFKDNSDGWGIMSRAGETVITSKGLTSFESFWSTLKNHEGPVAVHFRWATNGSLGVENVHPYPVLSREMNDPLDLFLMHNGVISGFGDSRGMGQSDTAQYIKKVLRPLLRLNPHLLHEEAFKFLVEKSISYNKFIILGPEPHDPVIFNKDGWTEKDNVLYSNPSVLSAGRTTTTTFYNGYRGSNGTPTWPENATFREHSQMVHWEWDKELRKYIPPGAKVITGNTSIVEIKSEEKGRGEAKSPGGSSQSVIPFPGNSPSVLTNFSQGNSALLPSIRTALNNDEEVDEATLSALSEVDMWTLCCEYPQEMLAIASDLGANSAFTSYLAMREALGQANAEEDAIAVLKEFDLLPSEQGVRSNATNPLPA